MPAATASQPFELPHARPRVMIIDDSAVACAVMSRICTENAGMEVIGCYAEVAGALAALARNPVDVVLLDIAMPGTDGLTALPDILYASRGAPVLVCSAAATDGGVAAIQAMALGAADTIAKPAAGEYGRGFSEDLAGRLCRLASEYDATRPLPADPALPRLRAFEVLALSASTGGIHALSQILRPIPPTMTTPIIVTQHLPDTFMSYFAGQLAILAGRPARIAEEGAPIIPGRLLVAPGDAHVSVVRTSTGPVVRLLRRDVDSGCRPSADPMLASLASVYGAATLGVTLSGMGRDGLAGAHAVRAAGGQMVVQDADSATVWGMPGAVVRAGLADAVLPPDEIGALIARSAR